MTKSARYEYGKLLADYHALIAVARFNLPVAEALANAEKVSELGQRMGRLVSHLPVGSAAAEQDEREALAMQWPWYQERTK